MIPFPITFFSGTTLPSTPKFIYGTYDASTDLIKWSDDGSSFTTSSQTPSDSVMDIGFDGVGNWLYATMNNNPAKSSYSSDGKDSWGSEVSLPGTTQSTDDRGAVLFGNNVWLVTNENQHKVYKSTDNGTSWTDHTVDSFFNAHGLAYDGTLYLVAGDGDGVDNNPATIYSSSDGETWTNRLTTANGKVFRDVVSDRAGNSVAIGDGNKSGAGSVIIYTSSDGTSWSAASTTAGSGRGEGIGTDLNGTWIAVTSGGSIIKSTDNGDNWTVKKSSAGSLRDVDYSDGIWVAVGNSGKVWKSTDDGENWTDESDVGMTEDIACIVGVQEF